MTDKDRILAYELHIEDMLHALQDRLCELEGKDLTEFEQGRYLAFTEMFEIIHTRHQIIMDVLTDEETPG